MLMQVRAWLCWAEDSKTLPIGAVLCPRSERPCHRRTAKKTDEMAPSHAALQGGSGPRQIQAEACHIAARESGELEAQGVDRGNPLFCVGPCPLRVIFRRSRTIG